MTRWLAVLVLLVGVASPSVARAQMGPPGGPPPGGSHAPGPGPVGPGPVGPGPGARPDPAAARRKLAEVRAERLKHLVHDEAKATRLIDAIAQHDEKANAASDEKAKLLKEVEAVLRALMAAKVTQVKGDELTLSVGSDEKVAVGFAFQIRHGAEVIARVVVESVAADSCLCKIPSGGATKPQKDDAATFAGIDDGSGKSDKPAGSDPVDVTKKTAELTALLDKLGAADKTSRAAEESWAKTLRDILGPVDAARVLVFLEQFEEEAKSILAGAAPAH